MDRQRAQARFRLRQAWAALSILLLLTIVCSCTSPRLKQFQAFSTAGQEYTKAMVELIEETKVFVVDADSEMLVYNYMAKKPEIREARLEENNAVLKGLLAALSELEKHTVLLGAYFAGLGRLAESEAPDEIGKQLSGVIDQLGKVHGSVAEASLNGKKISAYVSRPVQLVLAQYQVAALEREMRANSGIIAEELRLQEAAARALEAMLSAKQGNLRAARQGRYQIDFKYRENLGARWIGVRRDLLLGSKSAGSGQVSGAAQKLRDSYAKLAEGRFAQSDFNDLMDGIGNIADVIKEMKGEDEDDR